MAEAIHSRLFTVEEYLKAEASSEIKHEYLGGAILLRINFSDFPRHKNWRSECSMGILPMPFGGALAEERREP
jgi:hypothetical protein